MILLDFELESYKTPVKNIFYKCCPVFLLLVINCQNPLFFVQFDIQRNNDFKISISFYNENMDNNI